MYTAITLSRRIGVLMMETALQNMTWCSDQWCTEFGFVANDRCWDSAYSITTLMMIAKVVHIADGRQIFLWRYRSHQQRYRWYNDGTTWCKLTWNVLCGGCKAEKSSTWKDLCVYPPYPAMNILCIHHHLDLLYQTMYYPSHQIIRNQATQQKFTLRLSCVFLHVPQWANGMRRINGSKLGTPHYQIGHSFINFPMGINNM